MATVVDLLILNFVELNNVNTRFRESRRTYHQSLLFRSI
jgi:hypothetical protein